MEKKYLAIFVIGIINIPAFFSPLVIAAQEIKVFSVGDFDLNGPVKSSLVITDYGKEEYEFNEKGLLTKAITRYKDEDYDITVYRLNGSELLEKRVENYRDGEFVRNTSIANFYEVDTTEGKKITEKIFSYNKDFLDQFEYKYNEEGKLVTIRRINRSGIDETTIVYDVDRGVSIETYYLNNVILKSIRISEFGDKNKSPKKKIFTTEFLEGEPHLAIDQTYTNTDVLVSEVSLSFDKAKNSFLPKESKYFEYNPQGDLSSVKIVRNNLETIKNYHYQYDGGEQGNWVKQIVTPDNTYITRRIRYYSKDESQANKR